MESGQPGDFRKSGRIPRAAPSQPTKHRRQLAAATLPASPRGLAPVQSIAGDQLTHGQNGLSSILRNSLHNVAAVILPSVVALATTPYVVHTLGDEAFGVYILAMSVVGFGGLLDLGMSTSTVKFVAEQTTRADDAALSRLINTLLWSRVPVAIVVSLTGWAAAERLCSALLTITPSLTSEAAFMVRVASLTLGASMLIGSLAALPRAAHRFDLVSRIGLTFNLALTAATVLLLWCGYGLRAIVIAELGLAIAQLVTYWRACRRLFPSWQPGVGADVRLAARTIRFGGYMTLGNVTTIAFVQVNRIVVGRVLGAAAVTSFAVPWNVTSRISQLAYAIAEVLTPLASTLSADGSVTRVAEVHRRLTELVLVLAGTLIVPLVLVAPEFLTIWMGAPFAASAAPTLRVLSLAAGVLSTSMVTYALLVGIGRPAAANLPPLAGAVINVALALTLAPRTGVYGVAVSVLAGVATRALLQEILVRRALGIPLVPAWPWRPVVAGVVTLVVVPASVRGIQGVWPRFMLLTISGIVGFHAVLWAVGQYGAAERAIVRRQLQRVFGGAAGGPPNGPTAFRRGDPGGSTAEHGVLPREER